MRDNIKNITFEEKDKCTTEDPMRHESLREDIFVQIGRAGKFSSPLQSIDYFHETTNIRTGDHVLQHQGSF